MMIHPKAPIRIGSRGSQLALWQANHILFALRDAGYPVELEIIRTTGDRMQQPGFIPPPNLDGKGIFIKEIEEALEEGRIDLAVHSLKDLPTRLAPQFTLAAIPKRADARDVWVCESYWALHTLPQGGRIGTSSPRRRAQLLALRPDVEFVEIRGNIDTRLRKLEQAQCDALVLAAAGLDRLKRAEAVHQRFSPHEMCPAPGQGALALETRSPEYPSTTQPNPARDAAIRQAVAFLEHPHTRFAVNAERTTLDALGGGCQLPIGAFCFHNHGRWHMIAQVVAPDGEAMVQVDTQADTQFGTQLGTQASGNIDPVSLGQAVASDLQSRGALALLPPAEPDALTL
ncbi:MAG: hydroxymethylbilane synthase [Acidobacteriota bacterium]|nr:hydroxymethylbilane synthase [Acidobacteriota bacterium]